MLGWLLAGLASSPHRDLWIFKGGTCIKKCYFETYRFSEDLDFSLHPDAPYTQEAIRDALRAMARQATDLSGIHYSEESVMVRPRKNKQGQQTFEGRVSYSGPLAVPTSPRVLFDITQHEAVLDDPTRRSVFHPYPDSLPKEAGVLTYSFNELLAEKTRALFERSRPRDLYDVVFLLENRPGAFDLGVVHDLFGRKCRGKALPAPSAAKLVEILTSSDEMRSEWVNMLGHQLPTLPNLGDLLARLPGLLAWVDQPAVELPEARLAAAPVPPGTTPIAPAGIQYWGGGLPLESIRFAGANRLMIEFEYDGKHRVAEPYSLRRAGTGNVLLYAWEENSTHIKAFNTEKIYNVRTTNRGFAPRYRVELSTAGPLSIPDSSRTSAFSPGPVWPRTPRRGKTPSRRSMFGGPTYVFQCPYCQKEFRRSSNNPTLRKHKMKGGMGECPGRRGYLVSIS